MSEILVYAHGFLSSPLSEKARFLERLSVCRGMGFYAPDMNRPPLQAVAQIRDFLESHRQDTIYLMGSSLGGFYVTSLLSEYACRAVLINPAVSPWRVLDCFIGEQIVYGTGEKIIVKPEYGETLEQMPTEIICPQKALVTLTTGDEVLDWKEGEAFYRHCHQWILPGEDHRLSNILKYADTMFDFLQEKQLNR